QKVFLFKLGKAQAVGDSEDDFIVRQRFFDEVKGSLAGCLDGCFDAAMSGNHNNRQRVERMYFFQSSHAVHVIAQPDIEEDKIDVCRLKELKSFFGGGDGNGGKSLIFQHSGQGLLDAYLVIYYK